MSDGMLLVNFGALDQASADINRALSTMRAKLEEAESIGGALSAEWGGEAKEAYAERQQRWRTASEDLATTLRQIQSALDASKADYADTERAATQRFQ
ncbi:WXG100 family type VII secretion target [Actinoplanes sp. G11-F43]|uniref:WXG100 family type VII secretion target n=1 Tax=Actinoplanes sp. G11-F43 TaxID=3424130 RepID=UPI003D359392